MRTWLYNRIRNCVGLPNPYGDQVVTTGASDPTSPSAPKPGTKQFLLFAMGVEQKFLGMPAQARTQNIPFTVYVYDDPGSMLKIDDACVALKNGIPTDGGIVVGSMSVMGLTWEETGEDGFDDHYKLSVRPVRFNLVTASG